jgi:hypothetical protein
VDQEAGHDVPRLEVDLDTGEVFPYLGKDQGRELVENDEVAVFGEQRRNVVEEPGALPFRQKREGDAGDDRVRCGDPLR